jgi:alkane 1-monooxygenase
VIAIAPFFLLFIFPILAFTALELGGIWLWATPALAFVLLPILDFLIGENGERIKATEAGVRFANLIFWIYVPVQMFVLVFAVSRASTLPLAMSVVTVGTLTGAIGITLAHELVHRREKSLGALGMILLASVCYGHFAIEHVLGHHSHVATLQDPASARRGENVYRFVLRSIFGSLKSAWKIEAVRLARLQLNVWSPSNRLLRTWSLSVVFAISSFVIGSFLGLCFFVLQSAIAISLLELINYVEHYGLSRRTLENGKPEPVQLWHSWDSHSRLSGWFLIHLSRHADHHKYPARPFTKLEGSLQSPLLPVGYPASVLLATLPPLWYLVMHPRLDRFHQARAHEKMDTNATLG